MINFTREEKTVLVFLLACFTVGLGVDFCKKKFGIREGPGRQGPNPAYVAGKGLIEDSYKREKININSAGLSELVKLKGIGERLAYRIISYRQKNGLFFYKEDLIKVKGVGRAKFNLIKDYIAVE